jgi:hypothetical protein
MRDARHRSEVEDVRCKSGEKLGPAHRNTHVVLVLHIVRSEWEVLFQCLSFLAVS